MTHEQFHEELFGYGTGWLGWPPEVVWHTPIPLLELAIAARIDCINRTDPWRSPAKRTGRRPPRSPAAPAARDPAAAAKALFGFLAGAKGG